MQTFKADQIKIAVGLSGGVDSSVAAWLLKKAGFEVTGVYLKCYWTYIGCASDQDRSSAARVASFLNIPFEVWDFEKEYREKVIEYFYDEYEKGRTPNPDVVCNREIKFGLFFKEAIQNRGFNFIATGHYAGVGTETLNSKHEARNQIVWPFNYQVDGESDKDGRKTVVEVRYFRLLKEKIADEMKFGQLYRNPSIFGGVDRKKDQSYFLYDISQEAIDHSLYPLFSLTKSEVRALAQSKNLPTADRPDSQGICFLGEVNVEKFLKERITEHEGKVVDVKGQVIGTHKGIEFYTIGQRHGFSIKNEKLRKNNYAGPWYVVAKNVQQNQLVVGVGEECKTDRFSVKVGRNFQLTIDKEQLFVRIRHLGEFIPCKVQFLNGECQVRLDWPVFGVAPGQSAVFYQPRQLLINNYELIIHAVVGGGVIEGNELKAKSQALGTRE